jgi:tRNA (guanine-N7-)-methyltransferase
MIERRDSLFGRRKGKPLSARRADQMATVLPTLALDTGGSPPADIGGLFPGNPYRVVLEVGFGGGEHFVAGATREPETGFIGVEPFVAGMAKAVSAIVHNNLGNIRLFGGDASVLLDWLPSVSIDRVDLLYPDPWPKKRHWKRRFVSKDNLARLARVLKPGGAFRFASDIPGYVEWTLRHVAAEARFVWLAERADDWLHPWPNWPGTRYEAKALRAGRAPTYLAFRRV